MVRQLLALLPRLRLLAVLCVPHSSKLNSSRQGPWRLLGPGECGLHACSHMASSSSSRALGLLTCSWLPMCYREICRVPADNLLEPLSKLDQPESVLLSRPLCCPLHHSLRVHPWCCALWTRMHVVV